MTESASCGCGRGAGGGPKGTAFDQEFVEGSVGADGIRVPVVSTGLTRRDIAGGRMVRWDMGRMNYAVHPGLYAAGRPGPQSPVLVSANYKLSFDALRKELTGIDAWILVLDTKGINVWCAAGKGTFGTAELLQRIAAVGLDGVVTHRTLILPQLGAPGVSAPEVKQGSGFRVVYGPVRAADIPVFLAAGMRKDDDMRRVRFRLSDRMAVAPVELRHALPYILAVLAASGLAALPFTAGTAWRFFTVLLPLSGSLLVGTVIFPALLPYLPFQAFSLKGAVLGILWGLGSSLAMGLTALQAAGITLAAAAIVAFLAMNFTGASTFTCQTGAELEVRRGLVPMAASMILGIGLFIAARVTGA